MSFQDTLKSICQQVPGCRSAVVMNIEGMEVARHQEGEDDLDIEVLLIELTGSVKMAVQAAAAVEGGQVDEFSLSFDKGQLAIRLLNEEHFLAILLEPGGLLGKGRYVMRCQSDELKKELF